MTLRTLETYLRFSSLILVDAGFKYRSALLESPAVLGNGLRWKGEITRKDKCLTQTPEWYILPVARNQLAEPRDKWPALIIRQGSDSCLNYDWITTSSASWKGPDECSGDEERSAGCQRWRQRQSEVGTLQSSPNQSHQNIMFVIKGQGGCGWEMARNPSADCHHF